MAGEIVIPALDYIVDTDNVSTPLYTGKGGVSVTSPGKVEIMPSKVDFANLSPDLAPRLQALNDAWKADKELNPEGLDLPVTSKERDIKKQAKLYLDWLAGGKQGNMVAPPGRSKHEYNNAIDILDRVPDKLLTQFGLHRPYGAKDPVHVEVNPNIAWSPSVEADVKIPALGQIDEDFVPTKPVPWYEQAVSKDYWTSQFPKQAASAADVVLGAAPAAAQFVGEPFAKLIDRVGNTKVAEEALSKVTSYFDKPIGKAFGIADDPVYNAEATNRFMQFVGKNVDKGADYIAEKTGMDKTDAAWFLNAAAIKAAPTVAKGAKLAIEKAPMVGQALSDATAATLGLTTGVGADTVREAFKSGLYNKPEFWENLTGKANKTQVLSDAKEALQIMRDERLGTYSDDALKVFDQPSIEAGKPLPKVKRIDFKEIDSKLSELLDSLKEKGEKGSVWKIGDTELNKVKEVQEVVDQWRRDPSLHTVKGMDGLKRRIDAIYPDSPKQAQAQRVISTMRNQVKDEIVRQVPEYKEMMKNYEDSIALEKEIEQTLRLGPKASPESALRTLQSITRNNVNTAYGYRGDLAKQLEQRTGKNLISALSGQSMATVAPRGLAGLSPVATIGATFGLSPMAAVALPFESPGVVGAAAYGAGKLARKAGEAKNAAKTKLSEITSRK